MKQIESSLNSFIAKGTVTFKIIEPHSSFWLSRTLVQITLSVWKSNQIFSTKALCYRQHFDKQRLILWQLLTVNFLKLQLSFFLKKYQFLMLFCIFLEFFFIFNNVYITCMYSYSKNKQLEEMKVHFYTCWNICWTEVFGTWLGTRKIYIILSRQDSERIN